MKNNLEIEDKIQKARDLLRELDLDKRESPFEKARRFLIIQESLIRLKKFEIEN
jgi:hypothetical protein